MAYYLGRDVKVWITSEDTANGVKVASNACEHSVAESTDDFAGKRHDDALASTYALADITGVDLGIGVTDEDVSYIGLRSVLKAEIKKETTVSLTRKKSNNTWDVVFNGPTATGSAEDSTILTQGARWGLSSVGDLSNGRLSPLDHVGTGSEICYGYRVYVQLKGSVETIAVPNCVITGHTVTLNGDGTTEETMEFMSSVNPIVAANATDCEAATTAANL